MKVRTNKIEIWQNITRTSFSAESNQELLLGDFAKIVMANASFVTLMSDHATWLKYVTNVISAPFKDGVSFAEALVFLTPTIVANAYKWKKIEMAVRR